LGDDSRINGVAVKRAIPLAAVALVAALLSACGGGGDPEPALDLAQPNETLGEAQDRMSEAFASDDCDRINQELNPLSRQPQINTGERCEFLRRLDGLEPTAAQRYRGGAVLDYELEGDRVMSAALILDADGLWRVAHIDAFRAEQSVGTDPAPRRFDAAATEAVAALGERDCQRLLDVAYRKLGWWSQPGEQSCARVVENPIANMLDGYPDAEPERLGASGAFAFYSLASPSIAYTLILQRQTADDLPEGLPEDVVEVPDDAAEYSYVDAYVTNQR
jgi:hypothetical protein